LRGTGIELTARGVCPKNSLHPEVCRVCEWKSADCERCAGCATGIVLTTRGVQGVRLE
jgi:hypothetical protein